METKLDLSKWTFVLTYGYSLDVYAYGNLRIAIQRKTGKQILGYIFNK